MSAFQWSVSVGDILSTVSIMVGILLTWWQLRKANQQSRAEFIVNLMAERASNEQMLGMLYKIEYQHFRFEETEFPGSSDERALDVLLYSFSQVAALYQMGTITRRDLALIEYDFLRVYSDPEVQRYFAFLDRTPHGLATDEEDFSPYRQVAQKLIAAYDRKHGRGAQARIPSIGSSRGSEALHENQMRESVEAPPNSAASADQKAPPSGR